MNELDDARLVARIADGDEAAFVIAYDRHASYLFGSLVRFLGDREAASEVVQDAFVTLWRRAAQFDRATGSLQTWLLAIARHRAIDRLRAEGRRPIRNAISLDAVEPDGGPGASSSRPVVPPELIADAATDAGTVAERRWTQAVVRAGIAELPDNEREVIILGYSLDLSQAQIAARLEWPIGTVKSRTRRALAQLRVQLAGMTDASDFAACDALTGPIATQATDRPANRPARPDR
ncbi:MAG: sigma-70 family RNA polymerase sigma factor [Candidatus Limnocylindrales bacterium]